MAALQRNGVMAVLVPSLLPPPAPFKIFVLLAGVAGISAARLATAIAIGRGVRYLALGILAVRYGERAMAYMREHGTAVSLDGGRRARRRLRRLSARGAKRGPGSADRSVSLQLTAMTDDRAVRRHPDPQRGAVARRAAPRVHGDAGRVGPALRDHRRRRWQHGRELRDPGAAAGGRSAPARDPVPPQLRPDRGVRRRLRARARAAHRHLRRRSAERSARHPGDGRRRSTAATTSSAAGGRIGRTRSSRGGCRR